MAQTQKGSNIPGLTMPTQQQRAKYRAQQQQYIAPPSNHHKGAVHPKPIGGPGAPASGSPGSSGSGTPRSSGGTASKVRSTAAKVNKGVARGIPAVLSSISFSGWLGIILFSILTYIILKNWMAAVNVENLGFNTGVNMVYDIQGRQNPNTNSGGNPSANRRAQGG